LFPGVYWGEEKAHDELGDDTTEDKSESGDKARGEALGTKLCLGLFLEYPF